MHSTRQASVTRILLVLVYLQLVSCCSILTTPKSRRMVDNKSVPKNFSWLRQGKIAALAFPANKQDFPFLVEQGIGYLVTLSQELKPNLEDVAPMNWVDISVPDFSSFSMQQVQDFIKVCEKAQLEKTAVAVHCRAGIGRTGTMLACYLVRFEAMTADEAMKEVRRLRPESIETPEQEKTISDYYKLLYEN